VTFVAARLQGIGGAMMVPVGRVIIARSVKAVSYLTLPALLGPVVGPLLVVSSPPTSIGAGYS
jgi:MFS family permease